LKALKARVEQCKNAAEKSQQELSHLEKTIADYTESTEEKSKEHKNLQPRLKELEEQAKTVTEEFKQQEQVKKKS